MNSKPAAPLVNKLILLVLTLILGCLVYSLVRSDRAATNPPEPATNPVADLAPRQVPNATPSPRRPPAAVTARVSSPVQGVGTSEAPGASSKDPASDPDIAFADATLPVPAATTAAAASPVPVGITGGRTNGSRVRYEAQSSGSQVRMDGDSSLHRWYAQGGVISGFAEFDRDVRFGSNLATGRVEAVVSASIPVRTLKSSSGGAMDKVLYDTMRVKQFPRIDYRLTELTLAEAPGSNTPALYQSVGHLVVSGVTNRLEMPVTIESPRPAQLRIRGATNLKMTDFGIKPPVLDLVLGKIRTADEVTLKFEWFLARTGGH